MAGRSPSDADGRRRAVLPGARMDGASIYELLDKYKVSFTRGADGVADAAAGPREDRRQAAPSQARGDRRLGLPARHDQAFEDNYGVRSFHAWGMTEMSPLGSLCTMKPEYAQLTGEARLDIQQKQGHPPFGVEMKITDDDGKGSLGLRSSAAQGVAPSRSLFQEQGQYSRQGRLLDTGDVATSTTCR